LVKKYTRAKVYSPIQFCEITMTLNIKILESSFALIKPQATEFAASFYENLFTDYPQIKPLFAHTNMTKQQQHLISALVLVVDNLSNNEVLVDTLRKLGAKHLSYGTIQEHYPMVGAAILKTFESYLGAEWTPEVKQAWSDAYGAIASIMLQGAV
jgi:hemoglobin-like flavoprotein